MRIAGFRGVAAVTLFFLATLPRLSLAQDDFNSWTKPTSGNWEEQAYWSLNQLPSTNQLQILFTNSGWKAVAIGYWTGVNYAGSLQVRNLKVDAPEDSSNLLLLNYAGPNVPLDIREILYIGTHGSLLSYSSALTAFRAYVDGSATFAENSDARFDYLQVGYIPAGRVVLSNSSMSVEYFSVGNNFTQYGGSNVIGWLNVWGQGNFNSTNGAVIITNGTTISGGYNGARFNMDGGLVKINRGLQLGSYRQTGGYGSLQVAGGTFEADTISTEYGFYNQSGGSSSIIEMFPPGSSDGNATLSGGSLTTSNLTLGWGPVGTFNIGIAGTFRQEWGTHTNKRRVEIGGSIRNGALYGGRYELVNGRLQTPLINITGGDFYQHDGTTIVSALDLSSNGWCNVFGGTLEARIARMSDANPAFGATGIGQFGGTVSASLIYGYPGGMYILDAGLLSVSNLYLEGAQFFHNDGSNQAHSVWIAANHGSYGLWAGTLATTFSSVYSSYATNREARATFSQNGGNHLVENSLTVDAIYRMVAGNLVASNIIVDIDGELSLEGGAVSNSGTFTMDHGICIVRNQSLTLGKLVPRTSGVLSEFPDQPLSSTIDLLDGNSVVRFQDSRDLAADWTGSLVIRNWTGSLSGGGTDRIFVGSNAQGLTSSQLGRITFVNPAGLPSGNYPARILVTGEIVPGSRPPIDFTRTSNRMILSWNGDYWLLSATNVAGPYELIFNAASPYTNAFTGPQRFFELRSHY